MKRVIAVALLLSSPALAEEKPIDLKPVPGYEAVENNCAGCHSLDYIQMNAPFLTGTGWDATVQKMIKVFGAPIEQSDTRQIVEYLAKNYGG
jgi:hypothetical protein